MVSASSGGRGLLGDWRQMDDVDVQELRFGRGGDALDAHLHMTYSPRASRRRTYARQRRRPWRG